MGGRIVMKEIVATSHKVKIELDLSDDEYILLNKLANFLETVDYMDVATLVCMFGLNKSLEVAEGLEPIIDSL